MKAINPTLILCALAACPLGGCASHQITVPVERAERAVDADDVPAPARRRLEMLAGGNAITSYEREERGDSVAFEAEWEVDGREHEATVLSDGAIIETEREIDPDEFEELPQAIQERIASYRSQGYDVAVGRRDFVLYDLDVSRDADDDAGEHEDEEEAGAMELLLRPDGERAARDR